MKRKATTSDGVYAPERRGPHPVGVRTLRWRDATRDGRPLPVEVWFPAAPEHSGEDLDAARADSWSFAGRRRVQHAVRGARPAGGRFPLVAFSHHSLGHRRQSTRLCTHLASRGYVVAAVDHTGNTSRDQRPSPSGELLRPEELLARTAAQRPQDLSFVLDRLVSDPEDLPVDADSVGLLGHSMGGWSVLTAVARDRRVRSLVALAPGGGPTFHEGDVLKDWIELDWGRDVPTLFLAAECDSQLPLEGVRELFARIASPRRMVTIRDADHQHFCDHVAELHEAFADLMRRTGTLSADAMLARMRPIEKCCSEDDALDVIRATTAAHLDATLSASSAAQAWLDRCLEAFCAGRALVSPPPAGARTGRA